MTVRLQVYRIRRLVRTARSCGVCRAVLSRFKRRYFRYGYRIRALVAAAFAIALVNYAWTTIGHAAKLAETWEGSPYRIRVTLAIDAPGDMGEQLAANAPSYVSERANTAIGSLWRMATEIASGPLRSRMLRGLDGLPANKLADAVDVDKQLFVTLHSTPAGIELAAREYDRYVDRWGPTIRRSTRQLDAVGEQLFSLIVQAVSPLAHVESDPHDPGRVVLEPRGADLPTSGVDFSAVRPGEVLQPFLRRTTRDRGLVAGGVSPVPWTYLDVVESEPGASAPVAKVRNVTQKLLAVRRGRIEQVAIGLRHDPANTVVELRSRVEKDKPLVGYDIIARNMDENAGRSLGASDESGNISVTPGKSPVQLLLVRSGNLTLAAMPVAPGAVERIEVWLPDDDMRLRAAARLAAIREDIVDLVARRTILMARVRQQMKDKNFDAAEELMDSLSELPGPTSYNVALDRAAQTLRSNDVQVQRRIDRLFTETRSALGKYLDPQPIGALHEELKQAVEAENAAPDAEPAASTSEQSGGNKQANQLSSSSASLRQHHH